LLQAQHSWNKYCEFTFKGGVKIEEYSLEIQKIIYTANPHGEFSLLVDDLLTRPPVKEFLISQLLKF